jgi:glycosyltransferase involved in cell wall biosynthesis
VIAGQDRVAYGKKLPEGQTYRKKMLDELADLDQNRLHFTGLLPYDQYVQLLQCSTVHAYLTVPFVLSWSLLESMATGCLVVASDTAPVRELIEEGRTGLLFDFNSPAQLADRAEEAIERRAEMAEIRARARARIVERYALKDLLPKHIGLIRSLAERRLPSENAVGLVEPAEKSGIEGSYAAPVRRDAASVRPTPIGASQPQEQAPRSGRPQNLPRRKRRRRH